MLDDYRLSILAGGSAPPLLEDRQAQIDRRNGQIARDEERDMQIANAKFKRVLIPWLLVVAIVLVQWVNELVNGDIGQAHLLTAILNGVIIGCSIAVAPSWELRKRIKEYYKREREETRADFQVGRLGEEGGRNGG